MHYAPRILFCSLLALLVVSGCDAVDAPGVNTTEGAFTASAQIDYSLVDEAAQQALWAVAEGTAAPGTLARFGFRATGAVFTMSDDPAGNAVLAFSRDVRGRLTPAGTYPTEGAGSGDGLNGTSNPMALASRNSRLYAVNGGSDEISTFSVDGTVLTYLGKVASGGPRPVSVTIHGRLLYVLNGGREGAPGNVSGFHIQPDGSLQPLAGSTQPLGAVAGEPPQIAFDPSGALLVVTDKPTNLVTTYVVDAAGVAGPPQAQASSGETPFGFDFDRRGYLLVSEAFGGALDASAVSSYALAGDGTLPLISASVPTTETAACWVETFGPYAYATNTGSGSITGYAVADDGTIHRLNEDGVTVMTSEGSQPLDMDVALNYLYVHSAGTNRLSVYRIGRDGSLRSVPEGAVSGLPATAVGVAAY